ncbi:hypothetical protein K491DRAFT_679909 [Lophiostoma macrostomum CBS 122681]|uniref:RING-type domain-containing protein n=1 Tax=Lophiostoma macrostomum CBS 122681 TaxID=1314788 RepID=A0A6A6T6N6_9PLEO|nr:hypothetical protein K491DRAFT_679909 [Lophiostoma macrostomum CBS 122681]
MSSDVSNTRAHCGDKRRRPVLEPETQEEAVRRRRLRPWPPKAPVVNLRQFPPPRRTPWEENIFQNAIADWQRREEERKQKERAERVQEAERMRQARLALLVAEGAGVAERERRQRERRQRALGRQRRQREEVRGRAAPAAVHPQPVEVHDPAQLQRYLKATSRDKIAARNLLPLLKGSIAHHEVDAAAFFDRNAHDATKLECLTCGDEVPKDFAVTLTCSHNYCALCLTKFFALFLDSENPPKCCDRFIPLSKDVKTIMQHTLFAAAPPRPAARFYQKVEDCYKRRARKLLEEAEDQATPEEDGDADPMKCEHKNWKHTTKGRTVTRKGVSREVCTGCGQEYLWFGECKDCVVGGVCDGCQHAWQHKVGGPAAKKVSEEVPADEML